MSRFPKKCPACRERRLELVKEPYEVDVEHDGRTYHLAIPELTLLKCLACGNRILPDEADDHVSEALRIAAGLLQPGEIREKRTQLGLTQLQLAELLCIGEATLSRWETGAQIHSHHMDRMLRAFFAVPEFREGLERLFGNCELPSAKMQCGAINSMVSINFARPSEGFRFKNPVTYLNFQEKQSV